MPNTKHCSKSEVGQIKESSLEGAYLAKPVLDYSTLLSSTPKPTAPPSTTSESSKGPSSK